MDRPAREEAFRERVAAGPPPGLLAYHRAEPVGWVQVTPRDELPRLKRSHVAGSDVPDIDGLWAVSCFFVRKDGRGRGLITGVARAACAHPARNGARAVEAAALDPHRPLMWARVMSISPPR